MKKSDKELLTELLDKFKVEYQEFTDFSFIEDKAKKYGAKSSICIRHLVDFAFNDKGKLVGTFTDCAESFVKAKSKSRK